MEALTTPVNPWQAYPLKNIIKDAKMTYLWILPLTATLTACAQAEHTGDIGAPMPNEIITISYTINTLSASETWRFVNNNLSAQYTKQDVNGRHVVTKQKQITPNDFNWLVTKLEKTNYTKLKTNSRIPNPDYISEAKVSQKSPEVVTIETLGGTYTFQKLGGINLPQGFRDIVQTIPAIYNR